MNTGEESDPPSQDPGTAQFSRLLRISGVFADLAGEILDRLGVISCKRLASEYYLIKAVDPGGMLQSVAAMFVAWNVPVQHSWPCCPQEMEGFVEKAARGLWGKFGKRNPQSILIGQLNPGSPSKYYKSLASNLRGRTLQLFPPLPAPIVEEQDSMAETLFCLVGKEGLFCGMQSPKKSNGFYPGGTKFISNDSPATISRAGAKIAGALHYLLMYRPVLPAGSHWLELGASPGGMTSELLARGYRVTAVDRAPLDKRLDKERDLKFVRSDAATFQPSEDARYDAMISDLNGDGRDSIRHVIRLSKFLAKRGIVVFTLKTPGVETVQEITDIFAAVVGSAAAAGLSLVARTHLTYNRHEFTLFFEAE